jgi:ring-1,2-phenylacetyl-CoA epoxidase subunit PaaB
MKRAWPQWEIFVRSEAGLAHKHVGSIHAADERMALEHARDVYTRRNEGVSIWVVKSDDVHALDPNESDAFFSPSQDKSYRFPTAYDVPEGVKHL